jgi:hypothetical protein
MNPKSIEQIQAEIQANREAMLANAEKLDELIKAVKEGGTFEGTDLISKVKAQKEYDLSRSYMDSLIDEGWLTAYRIPGRRKIYLKRSQVNGIFKQKPL